MEYYGAINKNGEVLYVLINNGLQNILSYKRKKVNVINSVNRYSLYKKGEGGIRRETSQCMPFLHLNHVNIIYLIKKRTPIL